MISPEALSNLVAFTVPLTSSFAVGEVTPMPTFPPEELNGEVLASSSSTEFTIRFQESEERTAPLLTRSPVVSPAVSAEYPIESVPNMPKKTMAKEKGFFS